MPKSGGTFTGLVTLSEAPTSDLHAATKKYVDEAKSSAISAAAEDATSKANAAQAAAATDATTKANQALSDAKTYVDTKTAGLTGAMHFRGEVTAVPPKSGTYVSGDVVIFGSKEYVYDGTNWKELGDEGSHVLKTQKINGHALSGDITLTASDLGAVTDVSDKQDKLTFDGTYTAVAGQVVSAVNETDGKIKVTRRALVAEDIPTIAASKVSGLATVATSGKIDDLTQTAYIIFDAGTATTVI